MNKHILNGNKILGTAEVTNVPRSFDVFKNAPTHFYTDDQTIARAKKEYLLAFNDDLDKTKRRIVENRLNELNIGLVSLWIAERYAEQKKDIVSVPHNQTTIPQKVVAGAETSSEHLPVIEKLMDEMTDYITNAEWIDTGSTIADEKGLVVIFHNNPEKATEFVEKLPLGLETYCRADTGYVRIDFSVQEDSVSKQKITTTDFCLPFDLGKASEDELIQTYLSFSYLFTTPRRVSVKC